MHIRLFLGCTLAATALPAAASDRATLDTLIAQHAAAHGVPEALVHRIVKRESGYNPRASSRGNLGLMQIKYATARGMGYTGPASGLLDANTNLTYAVPYLANAYMAAGRNVDRAVSLYAGGYYYVAKRKGLLKELRTGSSVAVVEAGAAPAETPSLSSWLSNVSTPSETPAPQLGFAAE
ncbi:MAG TPA: lytic transglycosylase domain-containing protein [Chloroflexia bacterium]|nr:lytic transglycosylase domain-containing protein [Chloroflexia bacterium]